MTALQITCLGLLAWVVLVEAIARWVEVRTQHTSQVTTDPNSDHRSSAMEQGVRFGAGAVALLFAGFGYLASVPVLQVVLFGAVFTILRGALVLLYQAAANASRTVRLEHALKTLAFKQAPMALFFSAPDLETPDHVRAWEDELDRVGLPWFCITYEPQHFAFLRAQGRHHAIRLPDLSASLHLLPEDLKVLLYTNNAQNNRAVIKELPHLTHTQILHGDSDKPPSYSPLTKNFDRVFVAGQMAIDRYARNRVHIPQDRFRIVGRPQVAAITPSGAETRARPDMGLQVVYMPTWRGFFEDTQFSSLDRADKIIETVMAFPQKAHILFKPHPLSYKDPDWPDFKKRIKAALAKRAASGSTGQISPPELTPFDLYNQADLLICDISSVMIDFLYADKPFVTILPQSFKPNERANFPSLAASYEVASDLHDLNAQLEAAAGPDPLAAERAKVRESAFGDLDQPPGAAFQAACLELVGVTKNDTDQDQQKRL